MNTKKFVFVYKGALWESFAVYASLSLSLYPPPFFTMSKIPKARRRNRRRELQASDIRELMSEVAKERVGRSP